MKKLTKSMFLLCGHLEICPIAKIISQLQLEVNQQINT
jgi:hypothetical protein